MSVPKMPETIITLLKFHNNYTLSTAVVAKTFVFFQHSFGAFIQYCSIKLLEVLMEIQELENNLQILREG